MVNVDDVEEIVLYDHEKSLMNYCRTKMTKKNMVVIILAKCFQLKNYLI